MERTLKTFKHALLAIGLLVGNAYAEGEETQAPFKIGAIGDSITKATNSEGVGHKPKFSWSTGAGTSTRLFTSHLTRLQKIKRNGVIAINKSRGGARTRDIQMQATELARQKVDYATILIGANDLCDWKEYDQSKFEKYELDVRKAVSTLINSNPKIKIIIAPVPDMYNLWEINQKNPACTKRWDTFRICSSILSSSLSFEDRQQFKQRWEDMNKILERISLDYPNHIKFSLEIARTKFDTSHVSSVDCFHPSVKGQELIAKKSWEYGWF